jgi:ubiquinone/menaquinone biosynthesis C-methylase UbiE
MLDDEKRWDELHKKLRGDGQSHSRYAQEKEKLFPRNSLVVELGGATGEDAEYFIRKGHSVVLLDISSFALMEAEKRIKKAALSEKLVTRQADFGLHKLPVKDQSCDVVYSRISLNYFPRDHTAKIFKNIYSVLKPQSKAYLTFKSPDDKDEMQYLKRACSEYEPGVYIDGGQLRSRFTVSDIKGLLEKAGIGDFHVHPYKEVLKQEEKGHENVLLLNEVVFTKR